MKNLFLILFLILGIGITYAGKNYKVTVTYEIIYEYYDDSNGSYMGENQQAQVVINSPFMPKRPMKPRKRL